MRRAWTSLHHAAYHGFDDVDITMTTPQRETAPDLAFLQLPRRYRPATNQPCQPRRRTQRHSCRVINRYQVPPAIAVRLIGNARPL